MNKILLYFFLCLVNLVFGQTSPETIKLELEACKTDSCLMANLIKRKMIGLDDYFWIDGEDTTKLSVNGLKINIKYKNLFGDTTKEAVFEIAYLNQLYYLNFYFKENAAWKRVPKYLYHLHNYSKNVDIGKETLTYSFEEIIKANEYALVLSKNWSFEEKRGVNMDIVIINKYGTALIHEEAISYRSIIDERLSKDKNTLYYFEDGNGKSRFPRTINFLTTHTDCNEDSESLITTKTTKRIELSYSK